MIMSNRQYPRIVRRVVKCKDEQIKQVKGHKNKIY